LKNIFYKSCHTGKKHGTIIKAQYVFKIGYALSFFVLNLGGLEFCQNLTLTSNLTPLPRHHALKISN